MVGRTEIEPELWGRGGRKMLIFTYCRCSAYKTFPAAAARGARQTATAARLDEVVHCFVRAAAPRLITTTAFLVQVRETAKADGVEPGTVSAALVPLLPECHTWPVLWFFSKRE